MNSAENLTGFASSLSRFQKTTEADKKRLEEKEEIINLLIEVNEEIQELKKSRVTRDDLAVFFEKFLDEFSRVIGNMGDTKTKGVFSRFIETMSETVKALREG
ncbi:MAG TPA: hypothetical protein C5S37_13825 [Methanophagales archaeon]|nr:hypothetical protein [Methanophagales archaeon]